LDIKKRGVVMDDNKIFYLQIIFVIFIFVSAFLIKDENLKANIVTAGIGVIGKFFFDVSKENYKKKKSKKIEKLENLDFKEIEKKGN
jgi:hypothetical protein